jgi:nucleoid-associated protein YgaU
MGNFEKLVVLTVLFLSAIVLAVSLSSDDAPKEGLSPFEDAANRSRESRGQAGEPVTPGDLTLSAEGDRVRSKPTPAPRETKPAAKTASELDAGGEEKSAAPKPLVPRTNAKGHPRVLLTLQGLTPAPLEEYMVYTPAAADTWAVLAQRFYQNETYVPLLRAANEDLASPRAGEAILVPVFDFRAAPKNHEPRQAAPARSLAGNVGDASKPATSGATTYEVVEGDSLWRIAGKVYGSGSRWMEIYDANKDVMSDADSLELGMKLKIPR